MWAGWWGIAGASLEPRWTLARPSLDPRWERRGSVGAALRGVLEWPPAYGARGEPHATAAPRRRSANPMSHQANRRAKFDIVCHFREDHPVTPSLSDQGSRSSARRTLRGLGAIAALVDAPTLRLCPARTRRLPRPAVGVSVLVTSSPRRRGLGRGRVSQSPPWRRPPRGGGWELSRLGRALPAAVHTQSRRVHGHTRRQPMPESTGSRNGDWPDGSGGRRLGSGRCWIRRRRRIPRQLLLARRRPSRAQTIPQAARRVTAPPIRVPPPSRTTPRRSRSADVETRRWGRDRSGARAGRPSR